MPSARLVLGLQLLLTLGILAWVPGGWAKLAGFLVVWAATFRRLSRRELAAYVAVCLLFVVMDIMAVREGVFAFCFPDYLGLPVWEFVIWGFYVLHTLRMLKGPAPRAPLWRALLLAVAFAVPFASLSDPSMLLLASGMVLALSLACFHARDDLIYGGYMIALGALFEYTGVAAGQWSYPGDPPGGVPLWFATMWGGIGLFTRRLVLPLVREGE